MAALTVEHLKVMAALTVEPAYAFNLLIGWGGLWSSASGPYGRAPKGDGGLISRACLRILSMAALSVEHLKVRVYLLGGGVSMAALTVEHLKVMAALTVEHANASSPLLISRAP